MADLKQRPDLPGLPIPPAGNIGWPWTEACPILAENMPDGSVWPKISVVTASYNQGQFLEAAIRSVFLQGYPNVEYIIIDGGSTDNSVETIRKYEPWLAYWVSERDRGQSHAINKGIQRATGEIVLWLNSDDLCLPDAFQRAALAFHADPSLALVIGQARLIDQHGEIIGELRSRFVSWDEFITNSQSSVRQISTFFARRLFGELGLLDESLHIAMDVDLLVRFTKSHTPLILKEYLTAYRTHMDAKTSRQLIKGYEESDRTREKYFSGKKQAVLYRKHSSANWLSLSEQDRFSRRERMICMIHAIQSRPSIIASRDFWSSLKNSLLVS